MVLEAANGHRKSPALSLHPNHAEWTHDEAEDEEATLQRLDASGGAMDMEKARDQYKEEAEELRSLPLRLHHPCPSCFSTTSIHLYCTTTSSPAGRCSLP